MSDKFINIYQMKAEFSRFAKDVMKGKKFIIAHRNRPFAELRPLEENKKRKIIFGVLKNKIKFNGPDDFNDSLDNFEQSYYGK
jgi:antitoxin (DNA-binding transcriptional repressor) of toxin-antitoxin stability system